MEVRTAVGSDVENLASPGALLFLCGRAGAGKSTLARQMSVDHKAILICEDQWLVHLFDGASSIEE